MADKPNSYRSLWEEAKTYVNLRWDYAKLTAAERVTVGVTVGATAVVALLLGSLVVFFLSLGVAWIISPYVGVGCAMFLVAGFYALLIVAFLLLRKRLLVDPVARFVSRLFLKS